MSKIKLTGTELSSSLNSTGSFGRVDIGNADFSGNINMTGDGVHTISTANDVPFRVKSTDGTGAISIGDNSSGAETHNRIQVTGDVMELIAANSKRVELSSGAIVFNQDSDDVNFRIESNNDQHMLSIDGGKDKIAIGSDIFGDDKMLVAGNLGVTGSLHVSGNITTSGSIIAKEFRTEFVNQIVAQASGSTTFGDSGDDTHEFTGSVHVSGALFVSGGNDSSPLINIHNSGSRDANIIEFDAWGSNQILGTKEWSEKTHGGIIMGQNYHANTGNSIFIRGGGNENGTVEHHFSSGTPGYMMTSMGAAGTTRVSINYKGSISGSEIGTGSFGTLQVFDKGSDTQFWLGSSAGVARILYSGAFYQFTDADNSYGSIAAESGSFYGDVEIRAAKKLYFDGNGEPPVAGHTYISEVSDDLLEMHVGNTRMLKLHEGSTDYVYTPDSIRLGVGNGPDLILYHDGSNSSIENLTGNLYIDEHTNDGEMIFRCDDGSGGVTPYITLVGSSTKVQIDKPTFISSSIQLDSANQRLLLTDNIQLKLGTGGDLFAYHSGTDTLFRNNTGNLYIDQLADDKDIILRSDDGSGGVTAYITLDGSANATKFATQIFIDTTNDGSMYFTRDGGSAFSLEHDTSQLYFYNRTQNKSTLMFKHAGPVVINEDSSNLVDLRVETDSQTHALFTNASEDAVGMFSPTTGLSGSLVVGKGTNVPGGILMSNGRTFSPGDDISSHFHPLGHYTTGEEVFSIDPTWSDSNLAKYFNKKLTEVAFTQSHDAPGGYAIRIDGNVNVGGYYDSGFPYIPIKDGDVYYQEVWIRNVGTDQTHYMGSNEFDQNGSSTGGNPGSFGYWVMSNTNAGDGEWQKHCGYISGSSISTTGTFETSSMYWTPMALFNYGAGSGTRACLISGWKVVKMNNSGNQIFENMLMSGSIAFGNKSNTNVTGGLGLDASGSAKDGTHPWHGRTRIGSPESIGVSPSQGLGLKTPHGYVLHGPRNSSWNHIITDRAGNYFNAKVTVDSGIVESYDEALQLRRYQSNNNRITIDDGRQQFDMEGRAVLNMNASTTTGHAGISGSLRVSGSDGLSSVMTNRGVDGVPAYSFIGDTDTGILSPGVNNIALATAGTRRYLIDASGNHSIYGNTSFSSPLSVNYGATINEGGNDSDTRIEGSGDANLFRVDAGNDRVGIGTGSPGNKFTVDSTGAYQASIQYDASTRFRISVEDSGRTRFYTDNNADIGVEEGDFYIQPTKLLYLDGGNDTYIHEVSANEIAFNTGGAERMRLTTGGLGIGLDPAEVLDLKTSSGDCRIRLDAPNGSDTEVKFFNAGAAVFTIGHDDGTGRFVIGTTNVDTAKVTFDTSGNVYATADVTAFSSDKRLKENIRPIENALDKIDKLSGFVYNWNEKANKEVGYDMNKDYVGVFAQDVEKVQPEAVDLAPFDNGKDNKSISGENYLTVKYEKLVPLLIESIKELKQEIKELRENDTSSR